MKLLSLLLLAGYLSLSTCHTQAQEMHFLRENRRSLRLPFIFNSNLMIIPVRVNRSQPLYFIMDSGVQACILTELAIGDELNLRYARRVKLRGLGVGGDIEALQSVSNTFLIDNKIKGTRQFMFVMLQDIFHLSSKLGRQVHGLIGYPVFKDFIVQIDYHRKYVRFLNPRRYQPKVRRRTIRLPLEIDETKAYLQAKVVQDQGDTVSVKLLLDTGASHALWLNPNSKEALRVPEKQEEMFLGRGLNGNIYGRLGRVQSVILGDLSLENPIVAFPDSASASDAFGVGGRNGAIGAEILRRFDVTIDYPNEQLLLRPNRYFDDPFEYNMSGLELISPLPGYPFFEVSEVQEGSPADEAGFQVGDQIMEVNGKDIDELKMNDLNELFQSRPGRLIRIVISRNGERMVKTFLLRREI